MGLVRRTLVVLCVVVGVVVIAADRARAATCELPTFGPGAEYRPVIDRSTFTPKVDNQWFPLPVGTTWVYAGTKDGKAAVDVVTASDRTRVIDGVETRIVEDRLLLDGRLEERTSDYYAQDACGNVWYFGEDTAALDRSGRVTDRSGSFHAGVDGAQPGLFMQVAPEVRHRFRQEWYGGQAEDAFRAIDRSTNVTVPNGSYTGALLTEERTALEPGVVDHKVYAAGVGEVVERSVRGPREALRLVTVIAP
jgi:hypothetical protein